MWSQSISGTPSWRASMRVASFSCTISVRETNALASLRPWLGSWLGMHAVCVTMSESGNTRRTARNSTVMFCTCVGCEVGGEVGGERLVIVLIVRLHAAHVGAYPASADQGVNSQVGG